MFGNPILMLKVKFFWLTFVTYLGEKHKSEFFFRIIEN